MEFFSRACMTTALLGLGIVLVVVLVNFPVLTFILMLLGAWFLIYSAIDDYFD